MLPILFAYVALTLPVQVMVALAPPDNRTACDRHVVVRLTADPAVLQLSGDEPQSAVPHTVVARIGDGEKPVTAHTLVLRAAGDPETPRAWVGVRLTPIPAPLAAHIGDHGVMIGNVIQDSPADKAGLQQYDVVVAFAGTDIGAPEDLTAAVGKADPGKAVKMTILRKAQRQEVTIQPSDRPAETDMKMKYEEPEDSAVRDSMKMFGRALKRGPNGEWTVEELGPLQGLPDALKELGKLNLNFNWGATPFSVTPDDYTIFLHEPNEDEESETGEHKEVKVEVKVQVEDDGTRTTIVRDADGKIHVTRADKDGKETSAIYDNADALKEGDPAAYKLYSHVSLGRGARFMYARPSPDQFGKLRREFQVDVEKKLTEALEKAKRAQTKAEQEYKDAVGAAKQKLGKARVEVRQRRGDESTAQAATETLIVKVDDNGTITVVTSQDGETTRHEFKSKDEFKKAEPELYERVKNLLEQDKPGLPS